MQIKWLLVLPWAVVVSSCPERVKDRMPSCWEQVRLDYNHETLFSVWGDATPNAKEYLQDLADVCNEAHLKRHPEEK